MNNPLSAKSKTVLTFSCMLAVFCTWSSAESEVTISNGTIHLPLPQGSGNASYTWLEQSHDMLKWEPVARDYGFDWENTFPHRLDISGDPGNQVFSRIVDGKTVFFRMAAVDTPGLTSRQAVSRFLQQATFGPTRSMIENFPGVDEPAGFNDPPYAYFEQWIDEQIAIPVFSHRKFFRERSNPSFYNNPSESIYEVGHNPALGHQLTYNIGQDKYYPPAIDSTRPSTDVEFNAIETKRLVWYQAAVAAPDELRQRVAWALSQFFVMGEDGSNQYQHTERYTSFYDIFVHNAFTNFRDILGEVTWHPAMGYYLTYVDNKAFHVSGTFPDENYAREVMQLFTIGLWLLDQDGSLILDDNGDPVSTYDNDDIVEFAKVFTGMRRQGMRANIEYVGGNYVDPMRMQSNWHDFSEKTLLDGSKLIAPSENNAGATIEVNELLDHLFNHPNTAPFFSRFMIQRLTASNPSPNYIAAVSAAFNDNGNGVRGDMIAIIKAILLHPEARSPSLAFDDAHGKLREPLVRLLHYARAFEIKSVQTFGFFPFNALDQVFSQSPYESPSVFNFYLPEYQPLGDILDRGIYAPEFQIHTDMTSLGLANSIRALVYKGVADSIGRRGYTQAELDLSHELNLAGDLDGLLDHLDLILCAGRLSAQNRSIIKNVIEEMPSGDASADMARVHKALSLFGLLPEFNVIY